MFFCFFESTNKNYKTFLNVYGIYCLEYETKVYGPVFLLIIFFISGIAFVITNIKKAKEKYKEWKLHQNIIVNLIIQQPQEGQLPYNNVKNNVPLLNGFEIALSFGFMVVICVVLLILNITTNCSKYFYQKFVYREFAMMFFYNIIYPVIYFIKKKDMRKYVWEYVTDVML